MRTPALGGIRRFGSRGHVRRVWIPASIALIAAFTLVAASGCGGSSKPAYCSDVSNLQDSVNGLQGAVSSGGVSGLQSQLKTVQSDTKSVVNSAKSDFPSQTSAIKSSVDTLSSDVNTLPANPTPSQIATVAADTTTLANSVKSFSDATNSKCS